MRAWHGRKLLGNPSAGFDDLRQLLDLVVSIALFCHFLTDLSIRVHHGGVVLAAESLANFRQGIISELTA